MPPNAPRRYLIIGSGVAAVSAVEAIRGADEHGEIVIVSDDPHGFYSRPGLAYLLTGEVEEPHLQPFQPSDFERLRVRWLFGRATQIDAPGHIVHLEDGRTLAYDRLLVAVGAQAVLPEHKGIDLQGVVKLDHMEDARRIIQMARRARRAVVVGGGITALEIVEGLIAQKVAVDYFLRGDRYWGNVLDERESAIIEDRLRKEGVRIHYRTALEEVIGNYGRIAGVKTKDGQTFPADLLAVAIGVQPRLQLAQRSGLATGKGIRVDAELNASQPDIFAAGDAAEVVDSTGQGSMNTLWSPARQQGKIAGLNMAGISARYHRPPAFNVTRLAGLTTTIIGSVGGGKDADLIGIARGDSETWRQIPDAIIAQNDFEVNRLRLLVGEKTLVGAVVMGDQTLSQAIQVLVSQSVDIRSIRDLLLTRQEVLSDVIASFWEQWRRNGKTRLA